MEELELFEIRCPFQRLNKDGDLYHCNSLCVKVYYGKGETRCRKCGLNFEYEVAENATPIQGVKVKKVD